MGTRCADHVTPLYPQKLALTSLTGGGRSVGIVRVRTKATEFSLVVFSLWQCTYVTFQDQNNRYEDVTGQALVAEFNGAQVKRLLCLPSL